MMTTRRRRQTIHKVCPVITAMDRLERDGANSNTAIRRRMALIAAERKMETSETNRLMKGRRIATFDLRQFVKKHQVSADWLIFGDLKGRLRMARGMTRPPSTKILDEPA